MFSNGSTIIFQDREWTVTRGNPDGDGDIVIKGPDGLERYARADQCKALGASVAPPMPTPAPAEPVSVACEAPKPVPTPAPVAQPIQTEGNDTMSQVTRSVVSVALLDQDAGLKPELALVADLGEHVVEGGNIDSLKQKLLMDPKMSIADKLAAHNAKRGEQVDLDILKRTGNKVKLQPVEIHELTWSIK